MLKARVKPFFLLLALSLFCCLVWPMPSGQAQETSRPFGTVVKEWNRVLTQIEQELSLRTIAAPRAEVLRRRLTEMRLEALDVERQAIARMRPLQARLDTLGAPPEEGAPQEPPSLSKERQNLAEELAIYEGRVKQTKLVVSHIDQIHRKIQSRAFKRLVSDLLHHGPVPVLPETFSDALPESLHYLGQIARSPLVWWQVASPTQREIFIYERVMLVLILALAAGWAVRIALIRWCGYVPDMAEPAYARRLLAALATGLANGILPASILGAVLFRVTSDKALTSGLFGDSLAAFCAAAIFFTLVWALARAVLSPDLPAWRMVPIPPENAKIISRRLTYLAAVMAFDIFIFRIGDNLAMSEELRSVYLGVTNSLEALWVLALMRGQLWVVEDSAKQTTAETQSQGRDRFDMRLFWTALRLLITAIAIAVIPITLSGYVNLGAYLIKNLLISGSIVGALALVRGLGREAIGAAMRSRLMRETLAYRHTTRDIGKFWSRLLFDLALLALGVLLVLMAWGVPATEIRSAARRGLSGLTIGNVTLSFGEIFAAVAVFAVILVLTRLIQRFLSDRVLPRTRFDIGVRNSLTTGFGYLGILVAAILAIAALGLDLSNLAIIAGALSVGIGFGLQNVVNNYISGFILLIERPIKVGDWIICGQNEGFVKRIQLRATEIETFQRAAIIIPNAEIVSQALVNWTHKDRFGRVDVPVRVAYGSNAEQVLEILETCLKENETIIKHPAPWALFRSFGENGLGFEARGFIANIELVFEVETQLRLAIYRAFAEAGVEIPLPQRDLHLPDAESLARTFGMGRRPPGDPEPPGGGG